MELQTTVNTIVDVFIEKNNTIIDKILQECERRDYTGFSDKNLMLALRTSIDSRDKLIEMKEEKKENKKDNNGFSRLKSVILQRIENQNINTENKKDTKVINIDEDEEF